MRTVPFGTGGEFGAVKQEGPYWFDYEYERKGLRIFGRTDTLEAAIARLASIQATADAMHGPVQP